MMERGLGLKECPRCGLKNKGSSRQCDFCGYDFRTTDNWMEKVQELEQISLEEKAEALDTDTMTKIEATIIKPDVEEKARGTTPEKEREPVVIIKPRPTVREEAVDEPIEEAPHQETMEELEAAPEALLQTAVTPASSGGMNVFTTDVPVDSSEAVPQVSYLPPVYLVSVGSFVYAGTLVVAATSHISKFVGWGMVILGALLIVLGIGWGLHIRRPILKNIGHGTEEAEVVLCPVCHEVVSKSDHYCPNCHAGFETAGNEEAA